jgi:hypothetical protein
MRIRLETTAYYLILQSLQDARYAMIVSPVHFEEATAISDVEERREIMKKRIDSVKRHRQWQARLQKDTFFDRVFGTESKGSVRK